MCCTVCKVHRQLSITPGRVRLIQVYNTTVLVVAPFTAAGKLVQGDHFDIANRDTGIADIIMHLFTSQLVAQTNKRTGFTFGTFFHVSSNMPPTLNTRAMHSHTWLAQFSRTWLVNNNTIICMWISTCSTSRTWLVIMIKLMILGVLGSSNAVTFTNDVIKKAQAFKRIGDTCHSIVHNMWAL